MSKTFIIAEIGCNHNGDPNIAMEMIAKAKDIGVDAVKFQIFNAEALISKYAEKAEYQKLITKSDETQLEMTKKLEIGKEDYIELKKMAEDKGLIVFATPFDLDSIEFLYEVGQTIWKIPSGEITNLPYLQKINSLKIKNKKILLSTGMSNIEEIETALSILKDCSDIVILHCNTEYPTPDEDVNLNVIKELKRKFPSHKIGFSDHSIGFIASVGAVINGAEVIEKHFTLDKNMEGPDHKASAEPYEFEKLCKSVRRIEMMLGSDEKKVTPSEYKNKKIARKSIVAKRDIKNGEVFSEDNITCKRPGNGISPMLWYDVLGQRAGKDFSKDDLIEIEGLIKQE